jgi:hypothetical protein
MGRLLVTVNHPHSFFRTGTRTYEKRPPSNCRRARAAWDFHTKKGGPIVWMQLLDGYWGAFRGDDKPIEEIENLYWLDDWYDQNNPKRTRTENHHEDC